MFAYRDHTRLGLAPTDADPSGAHVYVINLDTSAVTPTEGALPPPPDLLETICEGDYLDALTEYEWLRE